MNRFAVSYEELNNAVLMGVVSIGIVGAVATLFRYGMGIP